MHFISQRKAVARILNDFYTFKFAPITAYSVVLSLSHTFRKSNYCPSSVVVDNLTDDAAIDKYL